MPATFHFQLHNSANKQGYHNIYLRITFSRKMKFFNTGIKLQKKDWNPEKEEVRRSNTSYRKINDDLEKILEDAQSIRRELAHDKTESAEGIKRRLEYSSKENFYILADEYLEEIREQSFWSWKQTKVAIKKIKDFHKSDNLPVNLIDADFLSQLQAKLKKGNKASTIIKNLGCIKNILKIAERQHLIKANPFDSPDFMIVKPNSAHQKTKLYLDQVKTIEGLKLQPGSNTFHARNAFILSFYFCGMRFGDLATLTWDNVKDGRLKYTMSKTGNNIDVKIPEDANKILEYYDKKEHFILPFLNKLSADQRTSPEMVRKGISSANAMVNGKGEDSQLSGLKKVARLAEIDEEISMHVARHSFAQYGVMKGISVYKMMMLLGHQNIKTTQQYLKTIDVQAVDETMDEIF